MSKDDEQLELQQRETFSLEAEYISTKPRMRLQFEAFKKSFDSIDSGEEEQLIPNAIRFVSYFCVKDYGFSDLFKSLMRDPSPHILMQAVNRLMDTFEIDEVILCINDKYIFCPTFDHNDGKNSIRIYFPEGADNFLSECELYFGKLVHRKNSQFTNSMSNYLLLNIVCAIISSTTTSNNSERGSNLPDNLWHLTCYSLCGQFIDDIEGLTLDVFDGREKYILLIQNEIEKFIL